MEERNYGVDYLIGPEIKTLFEDYVYTDYFDHQTIVYTKGVHVRSKRKRSYWGYGSDISYSSFINDMKNIIKNDIKFDILNKPILTLDSERNIRFVIGAIYTSEFINILITLSYEEIITLLDKYDNKIDIFRSVMDRYFRLTQGDCSIVLTHTLLAYKDFFFYTEILYDLLSYIKDNIDESILDNIKSGIDVKNKITTYINVNNPYKIVGDRKIVSPQYFLDTNELSEIFSKCIYKVGDITYTWRFGEDIIYSERKVKDVVKNKKELKITSDKFDIPEDYFELSKKLTELENKFHCYLYNPKAIISHISDGKFDILNTKEEIDSRVGMNKEKLTFLDKIKNFFVRKDNDTLPELKYFGDNMFSLCPTSINGRSGEYTYTPRLFMKLPEKYKNGYNIYTGYIHSNNFHKDEINGMIYSNRSGYYPSIDDQLIQDSIFGTDVSTNHLEQEYIEFYENRYNPIKIAKDAIVNLYLDTNLDLIHEYMMKVVEMTNIGYWEIKVTNTEVIMLSDKYRPIEYNRRLMYVLGDIKPVYLDNKEQFGCKEYFNKEDRTKFRQIRDMIKENFKIDKSEDNYLEGYYLD